MNPPAHVSNLATRNARLDEGCLILQQHTVLDRQEAHTERLSAAGENGAKGRRQPAHLEVAAEVVEAQAQRAKLGLRVHARRQRAALAHL